LWAVELRREETRRPLEDLIRAPKLPDLLLELFDPLRLRRSRARTPTTVDLGLLHPRPQRLDPDVELLSDPLHRPIRVAGLLTQLEHHAHRTLLQLLRVPTLRPLASHSNIHSSHPHSKIESLHETQGDSLGAAGYASRRDLSGVARLSFWGLVALIAFGVITIFVQIPNGTLIYSIAGLVIFAGLTMFDFQRLRVSSHADSAPLLAASIFLDALNVFLFFLNILDRRS
jgi:hypothetical protein